MKASEYVILVDILDNEIGFSEKLFAHRHNLLHRAFSLFIFRKTHQFELLLQQRALTKYHSSGLWSNTCCSHPRVQETILAAGQRRLSEELNISAAQLQNLGWFHYNVDFFNGLTENEIDHVLFGLVSADTRVIPNSVEVNDYRWVTLTHLEYEMDVYPNQFTPWLKQALNIVKRFSGLINKV
ncbi:MAG: isopentenyl-diphosphate Delta-isomerase [Pseudomonadota bacterium]